MFSGLFKRGILMSGTAVTSSGLKSKNNYTLRLAEVMGWSGNTSEKGALEFLRLQNAKELIMAQERLITEKVRLLIITFQSELTFYNIQERQELILFPFGPIIEPYATENSVIPMDPILMSYEAWSKDIDMIIGGTSDEGLIIYKHLKSKPEILKKSDLLQIILPSDLVDDIHSEKAREIASKLKQYYFENETISFEKCDGFLKVRQSVV